jgi:Fur family ferric uptake transcriptional regulator
MSCESDVEQALRESGRRFTMQRSKILTALRHGGGHRTADEIFEQVREEDPHAGISRSTVYRALDTLKQMRLVSELDSHPGTATFEWTDREAPRHHHLVCRGCGGTVELELPALAAIESEIERTTGFDPDIRHLGITGLCEQCRD